jgi:SM-20-related protein
VIALGERGYFVRDSFLGREAALAARAAIEKVVMRPAGVGRGADRTVAAEVRSDETAWLDEHAPPALAALRDRFEALRLELNRAAWLGLRRFDVQLARFRGGARYARHVDALRAPGSTRIATAICYLNPDWRAEHGGALRIHAEPASDVEPRLDRLVVFLSERVEHEVLPSHDERYAATAWYSD